jgi:hypothetical protein
VCIKIPCEYFSRVCKQLTGQIFISEAAPGVTARLLPPVAVCLSEANLDPYTNLARSLDKPDGLP